MQQHLLAENYPGLLDGLMTGLPDRSARRPEQPDHAVVDAAALEPQARAFLPGSLRAGRGLARLPPAHALLLAHEPAHASRPPRRTAEPILPDPAARRPVWGSHPADPDNLCGHKLLLFGADRTELVPASGIGCGLPPELIWNPGTNPTGERCAITDYMRGVFGVRVTPDAPNGKGLSVTDNVGVQYGYEGLQAGEITPEQFVDLNAKVGGIDVDGNFTPERKAADPAGSGSSTAPAG
jgi:Tannase-like family of unknown function (DUF6351)